MFSLRRSDPRDRTNVEGQDQLAGSGLTGRVTAKVDPLPTALSTEILRLTSSDRLHADAKALLQPSVSESSLGIEYGDRTGGPGNLPTSGGCRTSLARPGGNVTGLSNLPPELVGKRLEQLKQAVPGVSRVAILWHPGGVGERTEKDMLKGADVAARALGCAFKSLRREVPPISTELSRT